jgi:hypothetical protein
MQEQRRESAGTPAVSTEKATESLAAKQRLTWTVPEVARLLGISKDSAYEAAHRGELPVRVIGQPDTSLCAACEYRRYRPPPAAATWPTRNAPAGPATDPTPWAYSFLHCGLSLW